MCQQLPFRVTSPIWIMIYNPCVSNFDGSLNPWCESWNFFFSLRVLTQLWWGPAYSRYGLTFTPSTPREVFVVLSASDWHIILDDRRLLQINWWKVERNRTSIQFLIFAILGVWNKLFGVQQYVVIITDLVFSNSLLRQCCSEKPESSIDHSNGVEMITRR